MPFAPHLTHALALELACSLLFFAALRFKFPVRKLFLLLAWLGIALGPCLIPLNKPLARGLDAVFCVVLLAETYDLRGYTRAGGQVSLLAFLASLLNPMWLVRARPPAEARLSARENARLLAIRLPVVAVAIAITLLSYRPNPHRPFWEEHACKVIPFYFALAFGVNAIAATFRLAGVKTLDPFGPVARSRTPAEFWRRWNRPAAQFFHHYVFLPAGGFRRPLRATFAAFLVSALVHEYLFTVTLGALQGFQMAFFLLNGCLAMATLRAKPRGGFALAAIALTFLFELTASVLFAVSVNHVARLYDQPFPRWIRTWDRFTLQHFSVR